MEIGRLDARFGVAVTGLAELRFEGQPNRPRDSDGESTQAGCCDR